MKPESADYLANARATLADAQQIAALPLPHIAAREAYLAAFHAAEAYIFEHTGNTPKSHRGVLGEFGRLSKAEPASGVTSLDFSAPLISSSNGRIMALVPLPSLLLLRKPSQPLQPRSASSTPLRKCCPPA